MMRSCFQVRTEELVTVPDHRFLALLLRYGQAGGMVPGRVVPGSGGERGGKFKMTW